jgi:hypothetical protein
VHRNASTRIEALIGDVSFSVLTRRELCRKQLIASILPAPMWTPARTKLALYETNASNAYGLGVVSGQFRLHLSHNGARFAFFDSAAENAKEIMTLGGSGNLVVTGTARKPGGGSWADLSDRQLKTNIQQLKGALDILLRLRGVCFEWLEPAK